VLFIGQSHDNKLGSRKFSESGGGEGSQSSTAATGGSAETVQKSATRWNVEKPPDKDDWNSSLEMNEPIQVVVRITQMDLSKLIDIDIKSAAVSFYSALCHILSMSTSSILCCVTGFPLTWKTPGILCYTWNVWYDKSIYAGVDAVMAISCRS